MIIQQQRFKKNIKLVAVVLLIILVAIAVSIPMQQFLTALSKHSAALPSEHGAHTLVATTQKSITSDSASGAQTTIGNSCSPSTYSTPSVVNLATQPNGLSLVKDQPEHYQIYGSTASDLLSQIQQCAPKSTANAAVAEFTAETTYSLNWQYSYQATGTNKLCRISDVKVGQHITMVLPLWQPPQTADASLVQRWNTFMIALQTHENGHMVLDEQYANQLLTGLQTMPATDCSTIEQAVQNLADSNVKLLNQANDTYDLKTNHGATQGAVIPTN